MKNLKYIILIITAITLLFLLRNLVSNRFPAGYDYATHFFFAKTISNNLKMFEFSLWSDSWFLGFPITTTTLFPYIITSFLLTFLPFSDFLIFNLMNLIIFLLVIPIAYWCCRKFGLSENASALATMIFVLSPAFIRLNIIGQFTSSLSLLFLLVFFGSFYRLFLKSEKKYFFISILSLVLISISSILTFISAIVYMTVLFVYSYKKNLKYKIRFYLLIFILTIVLSLPFFSTFIFEINKLAAQKSIIHATRELIFYPTFFTYWILTPTGIFHLIFVFTALGCLILNKFKNDLLNELPIALMIIMLFIGAKILTIPEILLAFILIMSFFHYEKKLNVKKLELYIICFIVLFLFGLGPKALVARILPFSNWLVYDRFILHSMFFSSIIVSIFLFKIYGFGSNRIYLIVTVIIILSFLEIHNLFTIFSKYAGSQQEMPEEMIRYFEGKEEFGRTMFINCPIGWVELSPFILNKDTVDGRYNTGRLLPVLRESGIETMNDLTYHENYDVLNHFLENSDNYGIRWIINCGDIDKNLNMNNFKHDKTISNIRILESKKDITFLDYPEKVEIKYNKANDEMNFDIKADQPFNLTIKEAYDTNWIATSRGNPMEIEKTDLGLMKLNLLKGKYDLRLNFNSSLSRILILLSLVYFLFFIFLIFHSFF